MHRLSHCFSINIAFPNFMTRMGRGHFDTFSPPPELIAASGISKRQEVNLHAANMTGPDPNCVIYAHGM